MEKTANEKRLEAMRANLAKLENSAEEILRKGAENMTSADREKLLQFVNIAYHDSGKIEGVASIDGTSACEFCSKMRAAAEDDALIICGMCYAFADAWKEAAWRRHKLNARILSSVLFTREELSALVIPSCLGRINEDGDIVNQIHAQNVLRIQTTHNDVNFGFWYKNSAAVDAGLHAEGYFRREELPQNVKFIKSSLLIGFPARPDWFTDEVFTVFPDAETTAAAIAAGAWACNGRKCKDCKYHCYEGSTHVAPVRYIAEYLRTNKARRALVMTAYDAKKAQAQARNN